MNLSGLLPLLDEVPEYQRLVEALESRSRSRQGDGDWPALCLAESARAFLIAALQRRWEGPILVIAPRPERSRSLFDEISHWSQSSDRIHYFPAPEALFYDRVPWSEDTIRKRLSVLALLAGDSGPDRPPGGSASSVSSAGLAHRIVIASAWGIMAKTVPPRQFRRAMRQIRRGEILPPRRLTEWLMRCGYVPSAVVDEPGRFSRRGGIFDLFSPHEVKPVRLEYFGDEIESLRVFDPATQLSEATIDLAEVVPASEALPLRGPHAARVLREQEVPGMKHLSRRRREEEIELLAGRRQFRGIEHYLPYLYPRPASPLDYLPKSTLVVADDFMAVESAGRALENQASALRADLVETNELHPEAIAPHFTWDDFDAVLGQHNAIDTAFGRSDDNCLLPEQTFLAAPRHGGRLGDAIDEMLERQASGDRVIVVSRQSQRLSGMLQERGVSVVRQEEVEDVPPIGSLVLLEGSLAEGLVLPVRSQAGGGGQASALCLYTDAEVFGWARPHRRRSRRRRSRSSSPRSACCSPRRRRCCSRSAPRSIPSRR